MGIDSGTPSPARADAPGDDRKSEAPGALLTVILLAASATIAVFLAWQRIRGGLAQSQSDLELYYLPAARALVDGRSIYEVEGYFYSPLVAVLLAPFASGSLGPAVWTVATIMAALLCCGLTTIAFTPPRSWRRRALLFAFAATTLLWSWPLTFEMLFGQADMFVAAALAAAALATSRGRRISVGVWLGLAAMIKTWPAAVVLWLVRRGWRSRTREWLGFVAAGAATIALALGVGGWSGLVGTLLGPISGGDQRDVVAYSVWGVPRAMFFGQQNVQPLVVDPTARWALTAILVLIVAGLLAVALSRPGPDLISLYNVVFLVLLMLPVSHYLYIPLALPALWWWVSRLLDHRRDRLAWVVAAVLALWWIVAFRLDLQGVGDSTWWSILIIFSATLLAAASSVIGAALTDRRATTPARHTRTLRSATVAAAEGRSTSSPT